MIGYVVAGLALTGGIMAAIGVASPPRSFLVAIGVILDSVAIVVLALAG